MFRLTSIRAGPWSGGMSSVAGAWPRPTGARRAVCLKMRVSAGSYSNPQPLTGFARRDGLSGNALHPILDAAGFEERLAEAHAALLSRYPGLHVQRCHVRMPYLAGQAMPGEHDYALVETPQPLTSTSITVLLVPQAEINEARLGFYFNQEHLPSLRERLSGHAFQGIAGNLGYYMTAALIGDLLAEPGAETFLDRVLRLDVTTLIVDDPVKRVDNMTMAWGLEARVPFLDQKLVELAAGMPPELKLKSGGKHPLKAIARDLLPASVIDRPKGYFPMPALKYVRGDFLAFMADILNSRACRERGLFERAYVEKLLAAPEDHMTRIQGSKLWHLALLELWLQLNVDGLSKP